MAKRGAPGRELHRAQCVAGGAQGDAFDAGAGDSGEQGVGQLVVDDARISNNVADGKSRCAADGQTEKRREAVGDEPDQQPEADESREKNNRVSL